MTTAEIKEQRSKRQDQQRYLQSLRTKPELKAAENYIGFSWGHKQYVCTVQLWDNDYKVCQ